MSLAGSSSDINIVTPFSREVYRRCRDAGGDFEDAGRDVFALHSVLKHLKHEVEAPDSPLNRDLSLWSRKLVPVLGNSHTTLLQLNGLLQKRDPRPSENGARTPLTPGLQWENSRLGADDKGQLVAIRAKILSHKTSMTLLIDTIQLHSSRSKVTLPEAQAEQLDTILDAVDRLAGKLVRRNKASNIDKNEKELWKQFRAELVAEGFSYEILQQNKDVLKAYIREIDQKGLLDETPTSPIEPFPAFKQDSSDTPQSASSSDDIPRSAESLNLNPTVEDATSKDNTPHQELKFPQLMKQHMARVRQDGKHPAPLTIPTTPQPDADYYTLITPDMFSDDLLYTMSEGPDQAKRAMNGNEHKPIQSEVIETSDLVASNLTAAQLSALPRSFEASSYFENQDAQNATISQRTGPSISVSATESSPMTTRSKSMNEAGRSSSRRSSRLAPDQHGNKIPEDAKWTRIRRSLVSPEVLRQEGKRFEANPEYVAVLGQLSREEIQDYAARSLALREARWARPRPRIPRAYTYQVPRPNAKLDINPSPTHYHHTSWNGHSTHSPEGNSDSEELDRDQTLKNARTAFLRNQTAYTTTSGRRTSYQASGYPNPYGSPTRSRFSTSTVSTPASAVPRSPNLIPEKGSNPNLAPISPALGPGAGTGLGERTTSSLSVREKRNSSSPKANSVTFAEEVTIAPSVDEGDRSRRGSDTGTKRGLKKWKETYKEGGISGTAGKFVSVLTDVAGF